VALKLAAEDEFHRDQARTIENAKALTATLAENGTRLVSGGTDNHLALVDVTPLGVTGREAEALLDDVGITVNKNAIPFDANPPNTASGIRVGTPATTTRGMGTPEMRTIGRLIVEALRDREAAGAHDRIRGEVRELVARFPVPGLPRDRD
jgi:glycine hydroxymethyltransferase